MKKTIPMFSRCVHLDKVNLNFDKIIKQLNLKYAKSGIGEFDQKKLSTKLTEEKNVLNHKKWNWLKKIVNIQLKKYTKDVMKYYNDFEMTTSWFTKTNSEDQSNLHCHKNSMVSCVLYLQCDENSGNLCFVDYKNDNLFDIPTTEFNLYNSQSFQIKPEPGLIIFFPSQLHHKILTNKSNLTRYSLACNFIPVGHIQNKNSDSYIHIKK
jgi:uncharacterized protein (TIGR02466 family)